MFARTYGHIFQRSLFVAGLFSMIGCNNDTQDPPHYSNEQVATIVSTGNDGVLAVVNVVTDAQPQDLPLCDCASPCEYTAAYRFDALGYLLWTQAPIAYRGLALDHATVGERKQEGHFLIAGENRSGSGTQAVAARLDSSGMVIDAYPLVTLAPLHRLYASAGPEFLMYLYSDESLQWYLRREHFMDRSVTEGPILIELPADGFGALAINRELETVAAVGTADFGSCVFIADWTLDVLWIYDSHDQRIEAVAWSGDDALACGIRRRPNAPNRELILIRRGQDREVTEQVLYESRHLTSAPLLKALSSGRIVVICVTSHPDRGDPLLVYVYPDGSSSVSALHIAGKQTPTCAVELSDGSLAVGGGSYDEDTGDEDAFLIRVSPMGEVFWQHTIGQ